MRFGRRLAALLSALSGVVALSLAPVAPAVAANGVPHFDHVVVLIEENEGYATTFASNSPATYLNKTLVPMSTLDDQYFGTGHVSLDNYIAMTSGQPSNVITNTDCLTFNLFLCVQPQAALSNGRHIGDQLDEFNISWKQYSDGTTKPCVHDSYSPVAPPPDNYQGDGKTPTNNGAGKDYADRHVPFLYYPDIVGNAARCQAHLRPFTEMAGDIAGNRLPAFSFITPDTCNDGHDTPCVNANNMKTADGGLLSADAWLQGAGNVQALIDYLKSHNGLLIITFDEAGMSDLSGCCHGGPGGTAGVGGRVGLLAIGACVQANRLIHTQYDHASLLRTVEDSFGIPEHLNNAAPSSAMSDLFVGCPTNFQQPPRTSPAPVVGSNSNNNSNNNGGGLPNTSTGPVTVRVAAWALTLVGLSSLVLLRSRRSRH